MPKYLVLSFIFLLFSNNSFANNDGGDLNYEKSHITQEVEYIFLCDDDEIIRSLKVFLIDDERYDTTFLLVFRELKKHYPKLRMQRRKEETFNLACTQP